MKNAMNAQGMLPILLLEAFTGIRPNPTAIALFRLPAFAYSIQFAFFAR